MKSFFPIIVLISLLIVDQSFGGSATWNLNPTTGDWNTVANWTPATVPNGSDDVATFSFSHQTSVSIFGVEIELSSLVFDPGASAFTIAFTANLPLTGITLSGIGIVNNSGVLQTFVCDLGTITFTQNATAGELIAYTSVYGIDFHDNASAGNCTFTREGNMAGLINFYDTSTAGQATFTNNPGYGSAVIFNGNSTAGTATITNEGSDYYLYAGVTAFVDTSTAANGLLIANGSLTSYYGYALVRFWDSSKAGNGTVIANGGQVRDALGGLIELRDSATAENATFTANGTTVSGAFGSRMTFDDDAAASAAILIAKGGIGGGEGAGGGILFNDNTTGDTALVELFGNGFLDLRGHNTPELTVGSLEGDGLVFLGGANLSVGRNNLSTRFSGLIEENSEGAIGALTKTGAASLTLIGANTYTGGTTIDGGKLVVNNRNGSGTGSGPVQVNAGRLAGRGTIAGAVVVGKGSGPGATLVPGQSKGRQNTLTIQGRLTFNSDGTYECGVNTKSALTDKVAANGVTIIGGRLLLRDPRGFALTPGTVLTAIDNTSANSISGTFSNLADGSTLTVGSNTYQVNYEGGDGNDLTLTLVP